MIEVSKPYLSENGGWTRLCADVTVDGCRRTLWYAVERDYAQYLTCSRCDPFIAVLLPLAMRRGDAIICQAPVSAQLYYMIKHSLIPALVGCAEMYHTADVSAPLAYAPLPCAGAVGTGFSGGVDSLFSVVRHGKDCEYPLTHISMFNVGVFEGSEARETFFKACEQARGFAQRAGLAAAFVDSNVHEMLDERFLDVYSFRNLSAALALQGLYAVYLYSSGHEIPRFSLNPYNSAYYDLLTAQCLSTETISIFLSGAEATRAQKLKALIDEPLSFEWLHPCVYTALPRKNCGHCKKCIRDMVTLYALGALERYASVFPVEDFYRNIDLRIGFVLANADDHLYGESIDLLKLRNIGISARARAFAAQFRRSMANLRREAGKL